MPKFNVGDMIRNKRVEQDVRLVLKIGNVIIQTYNIYGVIETYYVYDFVESYELVA